MGSALWAGGGSQPDSVRIQLLGGEFCDLGKSGRIRNGHFSQHFAVKLDTGQFKAVHESAVRQLVQSGSCVDPRTPELAEVSFASPAIAIGIHERLVHGIRSSAIELAAPPPVALGELQHFLPSFSCFVASFHSHDLTPESTHPLGNRSRTCFRFALVRSCFFRNCRFLLDDFLVSI